MLPRHRRLHNWGLPAHMEIQGMKCSNGGRDGRPSPLALSGGLPDDDVLLLRPAVDAPVDPHWNAFPFGLRLASGARCGRWRQGTAARLGRSYLVPSFSSPLPSSLSWRLPLPMLVPLPLPLAEQSVRDTPARPASATRRSCSRRRKGHHQRRCHCP